MWALIHILAKNTTSSAAGEHIAGVLIREQLDAQLNLGRDCSCSYERRLYMFLLLNF